MALAGVREATRLLDRPCTGLEAESDADGRALVCVRTMQITEGLRLSQGAERIEFLRDRQIRLHRIDQLEKQPYCLGPPCGAYPRRMHEEA